MAMIDYRSMLERMRTNDVHGNRVPFDLVWVQLDGTWREEHGVILCGQTDEMFRTLAIDIRYPHGSHHDTRVYVYNIVRFNGMRMYL